MSEGSHPAETHRARGSAVASFALLTVSDTRVAGTDASGAAMRAAVEEAGHRVHATALVPDEPDLVRTRVLAWCAEPACDAIVASGGTGLSPRDTTVEALAPSFDRRIEGFGEIFRMLSFREIGSAAILSRATAGVIAGRPIFLLPGSTPAVKLALTALVLPEIGHILGELRRG